MEETESSRLPFLSYHRSFVQGTAFGAPCKLEVRPALGKHIKRMYPGSMGMMTACCLCLASLCRLQLAQHHLEMDMTRVIGIKKRDWRSC